MKAGNREVLIIRIVFVFWLIGWFCKGGFLFEYLVNHAPQYPIVYKIFPSLFEDPYLAQAAYFLPLMLLPVLLLSHVWFLRLASCLMVIAAGILSLHVNTYNDASYVTAFWVGIWCVWLSHNLSRNNEDLPIHAQALAQTLVGVIFLAGFIGKVTPEYWNGEIFYNIYFLQRKATIFIWLTNSSLVHDPQVLATLFSRFVIIVEFLLALLPFVPSRVACTVAPVLIGGIMMISRWQIFSVLGCLIGMLLACLFWPKQNSVLKA